MYRLKWVFEWQFVMIVETIDLVINCRCDCLELFVITMNYEFKWILAYLITKCVWLGEDERTVFIIKYLLFMLNICSEMVWVFSFLEIPKRLSNNDERIIVNENEL